MTVSDATKLHGFDQAVFVLEALCGGQEKSEIIKSMHGDKQLFDLWLNFLVHNGWVKHQINKDLSYRYELTEKGKEWVSKLQHHLHPVLTHV
jgi:predicted transcriptional regulator